VAGIAVNMTMMNKEEINIKSIIVTRTLIVVHSINKKVGILQINTQHE
jgi:hypothetical protein